jgi:quinoprotein dehydrogenase-associated probable ABC transporter substrate-binding protein
MSARPARHDASWTPSRCGVAAVLACAVAAAHGQAPAPQPQGEPDAPPRTAFKVCEDPNSLPFSNEKGEGFENRIAAAFAKDLGLPLTYYWFPNRMNFIRNTLRFKLPTDDYPCDIVMSVPADFDQVSVTRPYYRSSYVLVYPKGKGLDGVRSSEDLLALPAPKLGALHIGLYDRSPASLWLARHRLVDIGVPYPIMNADPAASPGQDIERDLAQGKIDAAILWGPIAGYYARRAHAPGYVIVPMKSEPEAPMDFAIAMGVRYGEPHWKQQVEGLLDRHREEIRSILADYGVPLLPDQPEASK